MKYSNRACDHAQLSDNPPDKTLTRAVHPMQSNDQIGDSPVLLPPHVAPSEDLTWSFARTRVVTSPYEGSEFEGAFDLLARALHRRQHPHALLIGERGVGKNLIYAELARRAAAGHWLLSAKRFLRADCRHVPYDRAREQMLSLLAHVAPHAGLVVAVEGLFELIRPVGGVSNRSVLLGAMGSAKCHLVGFLTPAEFDEFADDADFLDHFAPVRVPEPGVGTSHRILERLSSGLSSQLNVAIEEGAVRSAIRLSSAYVLSDHLPAKALRILTEACERADYDRSGSGGPAKIGEAEIVSVVADRTGIPPETLLGLADGTDYEAALGEEIFGQAHAVKSVATELGLIKAGMNDRGKPASVMLFLGQTGTGKTELAKVLARLYSASRRLRTYPLGNCVEPHSVSTVIGVPPGYVGSDRGGRLVNELNSDPYGVFLLDEADKAHPDVLQPFLNLFDEGWVVDQRGVRADATRSIFILTTNVGQRMISEMHKEGKSIDEITSRMKEALGQIRHTKSDRPVFTPEFLARIRRVIVFRPLDKAAFGCIVRKQIARMREEWRDGRNRDLVIEDQLIEAIGAAAAKLDEKSAGREGGRIVRKLVTDWIEAPLQQAMARSADRYMSCRGIRVSMGSPFDPESGQPPPVEVRFSDA